MGSVFAGGLFREVQPEIGDCPTCEFLVCCRQPEPVSAEYEPGHPVQSHYGLVYRLRSKMARSAPCFHYLPLPPGCQRDVTVNDSMFLALFHFRHWTCGRHPGQVRPFSGCPDFYCSPPQLLSLVC